MRSTTFTVFLASAIFLTDVARADDDIPFTASWDARLWPTAEFSDEIGAMGAFDTNFDLMFDSLVAQSGSPLQMGSIDATGDQEGCGTAPPVDEQAQIAAAMLNPLSYLWLLFGQNDLISYDGDAMDALGKGSQMQNSTLLMPVFSQQLTEKWKMIFRPVIPINSFKSVDNLNVSADNPGSITGVDLGRETGLGDIVLWTAFSNKYKAPNIFGFGTTLMLDTASDDFLGTGKNSVGPMVLSFNISEKWVKGFVLQHWWSFSGSDTIKVDTDLGPVTAARPDVNLTDLQVVLRYRLSGKTNIGMAPNWRYNWETKQLSLPIGIGFDTMIKVGKMPAKIGAEIYYYAVQEDRFGPQWQLRFLFVPVMASPESSRRPLFGN